TISSVLGVVAIVAPPPANLALGAASLAFGVVDAVNQCRRGATADCGMAVSSLLPGGKALHAGFKAAKVAKEVAETGSRYAKTGAVWVAEHRAVRAKPEELKDRISDMADAMMARHHYR